MKLLLGILLFCLSLLAQGATRSVVLTWTASTSTGVIGYNVLRGTSVNGPFTLLNTSPVAGVTYTDQGTVGQTYTYQVVSVAAPCLPTTPVTTACGTSVARYSEYDGSPSAQRDGDHYHRGALVLVPASWYPFSHMVLEIVQIGTWVSAVLALPWDKGKVQHVGSGDIDLLGIRRPGCGSSGL